MDKALSSYYATHFCSSFCRIARTFSTRCHAIRLAHRMGESCFYSGTHWKEQRTVQHLQITNNEER